MSSLIEKPVDDEIFARHLPSDFADRLVHRVRVRRRVVRGVRLFATLVFLFAASLVCLGILKTEKTHEGGERALVASDMKDTEAELTTWAFLGAFRECIRRVRPKKKNDEDGDETVVE